MQSAHNLANSALLNRSSRPSETADREPQTTTSPEVMDEIWLRMASRYGHSWVSQYGAMPDKFAGAEWRSTLGGLPIAQIRHGFEVDMLRGAEWPPSSTAFRAMCMGIPTLADIRKEVQSREGRRSPFAMMVLQELDGWHYKHAEHDKSERMLREAYEAARIRVMGGECMPEPLREIAADRPAAPPPADPRVAEEALAKLKELPG